MRPKDQTNGDAKRKDASKNKTVSHLHTVRESYFGNYALSF